MDSETPVRVTVPLTEIQRIRDELARHREGNSRLRNLWRLVAGLYQRLEKEAREAKELAYDVSTRPTS